MASEPETGETTAAPNPKRLEIVGLGSGGLNGITLAAQKSLKSAEAVYGYGLYLEQARPHIKKARLHQSGMTAELKRAEAALDSAWGGLRTVVVSGGDAGVYAMAGAVFEMAAAKGLPLGRGPGCLRIKVIPGAPALVAAAALLGAPLTHDFCAISLSDRLTPWELIERRLALAAQADFVIALYNPRSKGRDWQLGRAAEILRGELPPARPTGVVSRAGRAGQEVTLTTLAGLTETPVDMQTLIIIGNQSTFVYHNYMITPRGYLNKYGDDLV
ncbi:MAG: precorrin-3B C(17)-methyltransferase [Candidatus Adiutrix sp.]|jgi:precorrin-3B C17-methyltransferase|nr:precorrin-3B C(17)-methyltransferase [Candidatus Adiutrix sp.]